jgi:mono/diheme cytochrome c family protein
MGLSAACAASAGCSSASGDDPAATTPFAPWTSGAPLRAEPQSGGDPVHGRELLINGDYMSCGIPYRLFEAFPSLAASGLGITDGSPLPDRTGDAAELPHELNRFKTKSGADVVNANCLACHSGRFDGELVVGLGNTTADFTTTLGGGLGSGALTPQVLDSFGLDEAEKAELTKIFGRSETVAPYAQMRTVGMNPAEMFAVVLMVHHDRGTLAWSDAEITPVLVKDDDGRRIEHPNVTSDPPPWWRAHKKHALFYNGMARGDHRGTMALATSVCVDSVDRAAEVDDQFHDIQAYVESVRPPVYKRAVDVALAAQGERIFLSTCAGCHGTYAHDPADDEHDTYPNLLLPLDVIGTDPVVANAGVVHAPQLVEWYNGSFYGGITRMVPNDPFPGYLAPPLDGIWATAPYLHNGSVPSLELVLDSAARPSRWARVDTNDANWDEDAGGWPWKAVDEPLEDLATSDRKMVYDTSYWSQSNAGHTFGDALSKPERRAVVEYLKTL